MPLCNHGMTYMPGILRSFELSTNRQKLSSWGGLVHWSAGLCICLWESQDCDRGRGNQIYWGKIKRASFACQIQGNIISGENILYKHRCSELWVWSGPVAVFCSSQSTGSPSENTCSLTTSPRLRLSEASWPSSSTSGRQRKKRSSKF